MGFSLAYPYIGLTIKLQKDYKLYIKYNIKLILNYLTIKTDYQYKRARKSTLAERKQRNSYSSVYLDSGSAVCNTLF